MTRLTLSLYWTKEKPTKPGWYWVKREYLKVMESSIQQVRIFDDALCISNWKIPEEAEWAGPIPEPLEET